MSRKAHDLRYKIVKIAQMVVVKKIKEAEE